MNLGTFDVNSVIKYNDSSAENVKEPDVLRFYSFLLLIISGVPFYSDSNP